MTAALSRFATSLGLTKPLSVLYTHRGTGASGVVQLTEPFALIGRVQLCGVRLDDPSVSKKHVYVQVLENRLFVIDLNSRLGLKVDGVDVIQGWLDHGQVLQVGEYDVQIGGAGETDGRPLPTGLGPTGHSVPLAVSLSGPTPLHCPLRSALTVIGRHPTCNLRLLDERLSAFHTTIVQSPTEAWAVDLLGIGGTRLNERLIRRARLNVGDRLSLNGVMLEVQLNRPAEQHSDGGAGRMGQSPLALTDGDLISEMRQFTLVLAKLYTAMHQDQATAMKRQTELLEELVAAVKTGQLPAAPSHELAPRPVHTEPSPPHTDGPPAIAITPPPPQIPRTSVPADEMALTQAHHWFMDRLTKLRKAGG
jgi:pSer/pThr/pTyr-binding forkhead associated (FHA) protein